MNRKQDWVVTIKITETEDAEAPNPWYMSRDVVSLIRHSLNRQGTIRDLEIKSIEANEEGAAYQ